MRAYPQVIHVWLLVILWSSAGVLLLCQGLGNGSSSSKSAGLGLGHVHIDGSSAIGITDSNFVCATLDWWPPNKCDYGHCSWGLSSVLNLDLDHPILVNAIRAFSSLKIRIGGSLQDKVIYDVGNSSVPCNSFKRNASVMFGFTEGCLPMKRWDELNRFFQKANVEVIFGLNALYGRMNSQGNSFEGPWNRSNAASLIQYTVNNNYNICGWELGNELSGTGVGANIAADQYAADVIELHSLVNGIYHDFEVKPLLLAPGGFLDVNWFKELIDKTSPHSLDVISHHIYNLGPGVDNHLVEKILNPNYLDGEESTFRDLQRIVQNSNTSAAPWVSEAGGAYNSGRNLVSNAFLFGFWYLDQLGMASKYDTKTYCRQSLIGGNYGLLDTTTFKPNPDYYSALLWHRLMGRNVLSANFTGSKKIRAYAHCAKHSDGITLLMINLDGNTTFEVNISAESIVDNDSEYRKQHGKKRGNHRSNVNSREEYHLTAMNGDLHSRTVLLNGKALVVDSTGEIPPLQPALVNASEPITIAPFSIVFVHHPGIRTAACS